MLLLRSCLLTALTSTCLLAFSLSFAACSGCGTPPQECDDDGDCTEAGAVCADGVCTPRSAGIEAFAADRASVTSGLKAGAAVQGSATLSWKTVDADVVTLFANDEQIDLSACTPTPPATSCIQAGSISVSPAEETTYRLAAGAGEAPCGPSESRCSEESVTIAVLPPAEVILSTADAEVAPGADVSISYLARDAATLTIGVVVIEGNERRLEPCALAGTDPAAPCELPAVGDAPAPSGTITFLDVQSPFALAALATNGAEDGLGDVVDGEVELRIDVEGAPRVASFAPGDETVKAGDVVVLSWTVENATSVALSASPASAVSAGLGGCTGVDAADGSGSCAVTLAASTAPGAVVFSLVASGADLSSAPASAIVNVGLAPEPTLVANPEELPAEGGTARLSWTAVGADRARLEQDGVALVDTADGTGAADCLEGAAGECDAAADAIEVAVSVNGTFTLVVENAFGQAATQAQVRIAGTPSIDVLALGGDNGIDGLAVADAATETLAWATTDAAATILEGAPFPAAGCAAPDAAWQVVAGFPGGAAGSFDVAVSSAQQCLRLTAEGSQGQQTRQLLEVARAPEIASFEVDDDTIARGQPLVLSLQTSFASSVAITVSPLGAALASELEGCASVDGTGFATCTIVVQPGTPLGDVTFSAVAAGARDTASAPRTRVITVGTAPTVTAFTSGPSTLTAAGDVTLAWQTTDGARLVILDDTGAEAFSSNDVGAVATGDVVITAVSRTTTWTFTVSNPFGDASAQATTFLGPSFDSLTVNGEDALDGTASFVTGDASATFATRDATGVEAFLADVPTDGDCAAAVGYASVGATGANATLALGPVLRDQCLRLVATNAAAQSSAVHARLVDRPEVASLQTSPGTISRDAGGTIVVDLGVRGATTLDVVVEHLGADGAVLASETVCTEGSLNSGALSGGALVDAVSCADTWDNSGCILFCRRLPATTASLRYRAVAADEEADAAERDSSGGEDVSVSP